MNAGAVCRRVRTALNLSLAELAEYIEVPVPSLASAEKGGQRFSDERIKNIIARLNVSEEEFEILSALSLGVPRDLSSESEVYRAVKYHRSARKLLGFKPE